MFWRRQICPKCKIGKWSYDIDKRSEACPYIGCWKNGKCHFFVPLDKNNKMKNARKLKNIYRFPFIKPQILKKYKPCAVKLF